MSTLKWFFLQETKLKQGEMESIKRKLKFKCIVDCVGEGRKRKGGLALLWQDEWCVTVSTYSKNHIDVTVTSIDMEEGRFTGICGWPEEGNKYKTGEFLMSLCRRETKPCFVGETLI